MSHPEHPAFAMPGAHVMETMLVCQDGTCGRCIRCGYLAESRALVVKSVAFEMSADRALKEVQALALLRGNCLETIALSLVGEDEGSARGRKGLMELVEMTPAQAYAVIEANGQAAPE